MQITWIISLFVAVVVETAACPTPDTGDKCPVCPDTKCKTEPGNANPACLSPAKASKDCNNPSKRFSYDHRVGKCVEYDYDGCGGGRNSFMTLAKCKKMCPDSVAICPRGYHNVGDNCYRHEKGPANYETAVKECSEKSDGYLARFDDEGEREPFNDHTREDAGKGLNVSCHKSMDVVFLVDTSPSLGEDGLEKQFEFIRLLIRHFDFGPNDHQSQFAVIDTAGHTEVKIKLNQFSNADDFSDALNMKWYLGIGETTFLALRRTREEVLLAKNGARDRVPKMVIMISDGATESMPLLMKEAKLLKDDGVRLFDLLVHKGGHEEDNTGFNQVVSTPSEEHMFHLNDATELRNRISVIVREVCWGNVNMWIGSTPGFETDYAKSQGVMTTMNAAFSSQLKPMEEPHEYVCETEKILVRKP